MKHTIVGMLVAMLASTVCAEATAQPTPAPAGRRVSLRYQFHAGQRVRYETRTQQTLQGGAGQSTTTGACEVTTLRVAPDGTAAQQLRMERFDLGGGAIPAQVRAQLTRQIEGLTLTYDQDARGHITATPTTGADGGVARPFTEMVMQSLEQLGPALPERPVAVGETWNDRRTQHMNLGPAGSLDMTVATTNTLRSIQGEGASRVAVIDVVLDLHTTPGASVAAFPLRGDGHATGTTRVDLARAVIVEARTAGEMTVHVQARGQNIDVATHFENTLRESQSPAGHPTR